MKLPLVLLNQDLSEQFIETGYNFSRLLHPKSSKRTLQPRVFFRLIFGIITSSGTYLTPKSFPMPCMNIEARQISKKKEGFFMEKKTLKLFLKNIKSILL